MRRPIVVLLVLVLAACQAGKKTVPTDQAGIAIVVEHGLGGADAAVRDLVRAVPKGSTPVRIVYGAGTRVPELHGALRAAIDELAKIGTKRQVLVVVGSGHEPDDTAYRAQAARARAGKLEVYTLLAPLDPSRANDVLMRELGTDGSVVLGDRTLEAAAEELAKIISRPR